MEGVTEIDGVGLTTPVGVVVVVVATLVEILKADWVIIGTDGVCVVIETVWMGDCATVGNGGNG